MTRLLQLAILTTLPAFALTGCGQADATGDADHGAVAGPHDGHDHESGGHDHDGPEHDATETAGHDHDDHAGHDHGPGEHDGGEG